MMQILMPGFANPNGILSVLREIGFTFALPEKQSTGLLT
jgi:hypothetical protein